MDLSLSAVVTTDSNVSENLNIDERVDRYVIRGHELGADIVRIVPDGDSVCITAEMVGGNTLERIQDETAPGIGNFNTAVMLRTTRNSARSFPVSKDGQGIQATPTLIDRGICLYLNIA